MQPAASSNHWAFLPPRRPAVPKVRHPEWTRNPVDAFVLARLEREQVAPSPEADRATLLRRLALDLVGLPPSPEDVAAFVADSDPGAYGRWVDQWLASPQFGERWGRHWLDLARYADSSGYQVDRERPWAWVYRDWVLRSHNADQPFDEFTVWQIAGDLVEAQRKGAEGRDALIAAGFHRMTLSNHEDGIDAAEFAARARVDRVATTGLAWMGLTLGCAECHSHKYDPISQREFYQVYAFFNAAEERDSDVGDGVHAYTFHPAAAAPKTFVHIRGDFLRHGEEVQPGVLSAVGPAWMPSSTNGIPSRLDLARWVASPENPLTARVAVNQIWLHLFGRGLVATTEDFGVRGEAPSHPELLDWLALEFQERGWSRKAMIRLLVMSSTYRQASLARPKLAERDPENRLLARQNRLRLESEILRDSSLAVGGMLNERMGGPSFRPAMPADIKWLGTAGAWSWTDDTGPVLFRRSLYSFSQRTVPHPLLATFDQSNPNESCTRRDRSNTPLQSLTLLNNEVFAGAARALSARLSEERPGDPRGQVDRGFQLCVGRNPTRVEQRRLEALMKEVEGLGKTNGLFVLAQTLLSLDEFQHRE
ncbi:MAG: DUF1553 domain-containing protein [Verrucomicrobiales bacterium]|nr:DUF1553 domain-containing protein [Verrucomicrobiales bacterium]